MPFKKITCKEFICSCPSSVFHSIKFVSLGSQIQLIFLLDKSSQAIQSIIFHGKLSLSSSQTKHHQSVNLMILFIVFFYGDTHFAEFFFESLVNGYDQPIAIYSYIE